MARINLLIQVTSIKGAIIEGAKWGVEVTSHLKEGQSIYLDIISDDMKLISNIGKLGTQNVNVEQVEDSKKTWTVTVHCRIKTIRHSLDTSPEDKMIETMVTVQPVDRATENVLLYLYTPKLCDPNFIHAIGAI